MSGDALTNALSHQLQDAFRSSDRSERLPETCLLRTLARDRTLPGKIRAKMDELVSDGFTLQRSVGHDKANCARIWFGNRLYFGHLSAFDSLRRTASIACSHIGRDSQHCPDWPSRLECAVKDMRRDRYRALVCKGTTLHRELLHLLRFSATPYLAIEIQRSRKSSSTHSLGAWFTHCLGLFTTASDDALATLCLSPPSDAPDVRAGPVQDLANVVLADRVYCLSARRNGQVDRLLKRRLSEDRFAKGTVFVCANETPDRQRRQLEDWMDRGAVAWFPRVNRGRVGMQEKRPSIAGRQLHPQARVRTSPSTTHICFRLPEHWSRLKAEQWPFLAHCTRSHSEISGGRTDPVSSRQVYLSGSVHVRSPLANLVAICQQAKLIASSRWNRTDQRSISFSAVPLPELLSRRAFRSHLHRWDWEPYGLLIARQPLAQMGARPVLYGDDGEFQKLDVQQRPYFQPVGRRYDWTQEKEWRLLGDLDLRRLPTDSFVPFVQYRAEALSLSRLLERPVIWIRES